MCNTYGILFAALNLNGDEIQNKRVIEVGSMDVNGSIRPLLESYGPEHYIGVDIARGPGVDIVCKAEKLLDAFEPKSFDVVISTEMLEHVWNWQKVVSNLKALARPEGLILITARSFGFPYHGYPYDFWRYEIQDVENIFSDCIILKVEKDPQMGVFAKLRKPPNFVETDLSSYRLYSIIVNRRVIQPDKAELVSFLQAQEKDKRIRVLIDKIEAVIWFITDRLRV